MCENFVESAIFINCSEQMRILPHSGLIGYSIALLFFGQSWRYQRDDNSLDALFEPTKSR